MSKIKGFRIPGVYLSLKGIKVTKTKGFVGFNLACKWKRKYRSWTPEEGWFILTNLESLEIAIKAYKRRFDIEEMKIKRMGVQKYVGRIKEFGRIERRHSSFYIGLYGDNWVNFMGPCWELVPELMKLNRNKRSFYQRGLRAMRLILQAS